MNKKKQFDRKNVIIAKIDEKDLATFLLDTDIKDCGRYGCRISDFCDTIMNAIPEYVYAAYKDTTIDQNDIVEKLREAAKSIYKIKDYELNKRAYLDEDSEAEKEVVNSAQRRGEFGEIILHVLLRDFKGTIPLISKVYFKDSPGVPAHGFDAVHISPDEKILWLGESKFYVDSKEGIRRLIEDISTHFVHDYLKEQFIIIKKNLENNKIEGREKWINILEQTNKLEDKVRMIYIPLLCIYEHDLYKKFEYDLGNDEAILYHEMNARDLKAYFDDKNEHMLKNKLTIILFLLPIDNKKELVRRLHEKLWHMQGI